MFLRDVIVNLLQIYCYIIIARVLISWFSPNVYNPFWRFLVDITEPLLGYIREILRKILPVFGTIDISPIVLIILINFTILLLRGAF